MLALQQPAAAQEQAGVTAAVRGRVELAARPGEVGRLVKSGEPVFLGNAIKSGSDAGLQLLLLDQTTFTIGPDSEMTIDQFVYDPARGSGKVTASVAKGVFRFVTGKVAQNNPADMTVKLPVGTIGIRGTIAMGSVDRPSGQTLDGLKQQVVLVGPGSGVDSKDRAGAIAVGQDNAIININQPGFGSQWGFGSPGWSDPIRFSTEMISAIQAKLNPPPPPGGGGQGQGTGGQATTNAGAGALQAKSEVRQYALLANTITTSDTISDESSQQGLRDRTVMAPIVVDGASTFVQLRTVNSGQFFYQGSAGLLDNARRSIGSYNIFANIDFGNRSFGGPNSRAEFSSANFNGTVNLFQQDFRSGPQTATFGYTNLTGVTGQGCSSGCRVDLNVTPQNLGGVIGATANHDATVNALINFGQVTVLNQIATGAGTATRVVGQAPRP